MIKRLLTRFVLILAALYLAGCASGPKYAEGADSITQPDAEMARIYIYRTTVLGAAVQPDVKLNDEVVGKATAKGFFYVDVEPGNYRVMTSTEVDRHLSLVMEAGQTRYVRLNISMGFFVGHVYPELVDNAVGAVEIEECSYTGQL